MARLILAEPLPSSAPFGTITHPEPGANMRRRREFLGLVGAAAAWPVGARAQQTERVRRIGILGNLKPDDAESQARIKAFLRGLQEKGWTEGHNIRIDYRWATSNLREHAAELLALTPDAVLANANPSLSAFQSLSRTIPIVFVAASDPVNSGAVESLSRPGGNATGFTTAEFGMSGKWLELLKEISPSVKRVAVLQDPISGSSSVAQFAAIQALAPSLNIDLVSIILRSDGQIEKAITTFAQTPDTALIATRTAAPIRHHALIVSLAARLRLPAIYPLRSFVISGGLISYGPDIVDQYRLAASYVDRILRGEKPANLPVQAPTKYELVINLKTVKALGLTVPPSVLARSDEVIE
jgi:putative ABC transport system substrate-binding protein